MKGALLILKPDGTRETRQLTGEPGLDVLHEIVGGYIEVVPYFKTIEIDGRVHECIAFCNENGKINRLPVNRFATLEWDSALRRAGLATGLAYVSGSPMPPDQFGLSDHLVGSIAVVIGDDVLRAMRTDHEAEEEANEN
jgi:Domain of unknown function (DUF3846)